MCKGILPSNTPLIIPQRSTDSASCALGYASVVEVVQDKVEALSLDAQVDVLVSEPMGTLLVNERMLETYIYARNRYLKKGGRMFPVSKIPQPTLAVHFSGEWHQA